MTLDDGAIAFWDRMEAQRVAKLSEEGAAVEVGPRLVGIHAGPLASDPQPLAFRGTPPNVSGS